MVSDEVSFSPWCVSRSKALGMLATDEILLQPSVGYIMGILLRVFPQASEAEGLILSEANAPPVHRGALNHLNCVGQIKLQVYSRLP